MGMLGDTAHFYLAKLLTMVEEEGRWPEALREVRGVCLPKTDPPNHEDPLKYRIMQPLPAVYRLWARTRLAQVGQWVRGWAHPALHAGVPSKGADVAWWEVAMTVEQGLMEGTDSIIAAFGLTKAF